MIEEKTYVYKVFTKRMVFKGCGSIPQEYATQDIVDTASEQLAWKVFVYYLTGKTIDFKFSKYDKNRIFQLRKDFQKRGWVRFDQQTHCWEEKLQLNLQKQSLSTDYYFDDQLNPLMNIHQEEESQQQEEQFEEEIQKNQQMDFQEEKSQVETKIKELQI